MNNHASNPEYQAAVVKGTIEGKPQRTIAKETGSSQATVSRTLQREDAKARIEAAVNELIETSLDPAKKNIARLIQNYWDETDPKRLDHGYKATVKLLEAVGILPARTTSVLIQNIVNAETPLIPPIIQKLLDAEKEANRDCPELIEVDFSDIKRG